MRIISGIAKKRKLISFKGSARPTSDRIKETLFNVLGDIEGMSFLDLFAGTGSVGIEALSRGASKVYFIEKSKKMSRIITRNIISAGFLENSKIITTEVGKKLFKQLKEENIGFDIIFADPPYDKNFTTRFFKIIELSILSQNGILILQHSEREKPDTLPKRDIKIGDSVLSFYERN